MNCLPCLRGKKSEGKNSEGKKADGENSESKEDEELLPVAQPKENQISKQPSAKNEDKKQDYEGAHPAPISATVDAATDEFVADSASTFMFQDLASATKNFKQECLLGESQFGKVYKGTLADGKVVAVKKLDTHGANANKEFIKEVIKLSELHHQNLVELIGHCADGDHRLLVYEYMQMGSIRDQLHDLPPGKKPLDWITRMKAVAGAAKAIEYLHEKINPPILCFNIKSSNVFFDENFNPKVGDYGLINLESSPGSGVHERVMGTVCGAPEYECKGELTIKYDVYSFGVLILELITGRKTLDTSRPTNEQSLVSWAMPYFNDRKRFHELVDPMFKGVVPENILNQAVDVAARCLREESSVRPLISNIIEDLNSLTVAPPEGYLDSPPKKYPLSPLSSSSSSSGSELDHELDFKIEPFNRPEPQPQLEPESTHESDQEHEPEWESDPDTDSEQEPEPESEPELEPEPEPEQEPDSDTDSDSGSDTESEPVQASNPESVVELEVSTSRKDQTDSDSDSDSESEPEQVAKLKPVTEPEPSTSRKDEPDSDHDSNSTSGSVYDEDAYMEEEFSDEEKPSTSEAKMETKSSKKKVMFKTEETDPKMQRINSSYNKKSFKKSNNEPIKKRNSSRMRKSDTRRDDNSDIEFTDGSDDEFEPQRFKSTISRFTAESRCYSAYQDENVHGSSSDAEN